MSGSSAGPSRRYSGTGTNPLDRVGADTRFPVSAGSTVDPGPFRRDAAFELRGKGEVDGSVRRVPVPLASRPSEITLGSRCLKQYDPERLDQRAPSIPMLRWDFHTAQSTDAYRLEHLSTPSRFQAVAASPAKPRCASCLPRARPRSRPRPSLGSGRRSTPRRACNARIRVDEPSPSHRERRARSARRSHRWGTQFRP